MVNLLTVPIEDLTIQFDTPERPLAIDIGRVVVIDSRTVQQRHFFGFPLVGPMIRQVVGANSYNGINNWMNNEFYLRNTVATCRSGVCVLVRTGLGESVAEEVEELICIYVVPFKVIIGLIDG